MKHKNTHQALPFTKTKAANTNNEPSPQPKTVSRAVSTSLNRFRRDERGLSTVEYVILLVLIAVGSIALWTSFGTALMTHISDSTADLSGMAPEPPEG